MKGKINCLDMVIFKNFFIGNAFVDPKSTTPIVFNSK